MSDTYAIIGKLKLQKVEGAKTLQMGFYGGLPYAVGKDITEDDLLVIFLPDSQLSQEFCDEHDLIAKNDPITGKKINKGYFGKNRKVRSITLMGGKIRSVGLVMSLDSLKFTGIDINSLKEGDGFNELNGIPICNKYINPNTEKVNKNKSKMFLRKREEVGLPMHPDTAQFYRFGKTLEKGDLITLTLKLDGTSVRIANTYIKRKFNWFEKLMSQIGLKIQNIEFQYLVGTRRVIIDRSNVSSFYGDNHKIYKEVGESLDGKLMPGEGVYGEIVGFEDSGKPLFNRGGMIFKYGCTLGKRAFYVYNIKHTLPNGNTIDLSWNIIKQRCNDLGLKYVPEMEIEWNESKKLNLPQNLIEYNPQFIYDGNLKNLEQLVYSFVDGNDPIDPSHIREGVVLRVEKADGSGVVFYKAKSEAFYNLEDKSKNAGDIDIEERQDNR